MGLYDCLWHFVGWFTKISVREYRLCGANWQYTESYGSIWTMLSLYGKYGIIWNFLKHFLLNRASNMLYIGISGNIWQNMALYDTLSDTYHLIRPITYTIWQYMGLYESIWQCTALVGTLLLDLAWRIHYMAHLSLDLAWYIDIFYVLCFPLSFRAVVTQFTFHILIACLQLLSHLPFSYFPLPPPSHSFFDAGPTTSAAAAAAAIFNAIRCAWFDILITFTALLCLWAQPGLAI